MAVLKLAKDRTRRWFVARAAGEIHLDEVLTFVRTVRASEEDRHTPLLFDARGCGTSMTPDDVEPAAQLAAKVGRESGPRAHVALIADDPVLRAWFVAYETRCAGLGIRVIRTFATLAAGEQWLATLTNARYFTIG
jgi:hypothetical protein